MFPRRVLPMLKNKVQLQLIGLIICSRAEKLKDYKLLRRSGQIAETGLSNIDYILYSHAEFTVKIQPGLYAYDCARRDNLTARRSKSRRFVYITSHTVTQTVSETVGAAF